MKKYSWHDDQGVRRVLKELCGYDFCGYNAMPDVLSNCDAVRLALFMVDELQRVKAELVEANEKTKAELLEANEKLQRELVEAKAVDDYAKDRFLALQAAVRGGSARQEFPVGTILSDRWTDVRTNETFDMPWRIVDYREIRATPDGEPRPAAILLRTNVASGEIVFDLYGRCVYAVSSICAYMIADYELGCSAEIRKVISPIWLPEEKVIAKFFLPSPEELHSDVRGASQLDELAWKYFRDTPTYGLCGRRIFYDALTGHRARNVWLRSCGGGNSGVYDIEVDGRANIDDPSNGLGVLVTCAIA